MRGTVFCRKVFTNLRRHYGKNVRIGCASGFWGDTVVSTPQLLNSKAKVDFIVYDYLSEITMSLLCAAKAKDPNLGYCPDFVLFHMQPYVADFKKKGVKIVSNAGGINPHACAEALQKVAQSKNVTNLNVAVITGDDLMPKKGDFADVKDMDSGDKFPNTIVSLNAYFGAGPIRRALDLGADIVITGRCVDSALALGPLMHAFSWDESSIKAMAVGSAAGHLIECGAQATGGISTDWATMTRWENIGFPIAEFDQNDPHCFRITKPEGTGGAVNFGTVAEQLVYEIGDPACYQLPDVTVDFTQAQLQDMGNNVVQVTGVEGLAPSDKYKVSGTYASGYRCIAVCPIVGPQAAEKGRKTAEAILTRCRNIFRQLKLADFTKTEVRVIGAEESYGPHANKVVPMNGVQNSREVMLWIGAHHTEKKALELFSREIAPAGTGMAPGLTTSVGGRPRVSPVLKLFSCLVPKDSAKAEIFLNGKHMETYSAPKIEATKIVPSACAGPSTTKVTGNRSCLLSELAYTRSGDKGDTANIGVICRNAADYPLLKHHLTAERVTEYFAHFLGLKQGQHVRRFEIPGIKGFNFVLPASLGGGGVSSLRIDPQGKAYGQMLLDMRLEGLAERQ